MNWSDFEVKRSKINRMYISGGFSDQCTAVENHL